MEIIIFEFQILISYIKPYLLNLFFQANFLINCGILNLLEIVNLDDRALYIKSVSEVQKLLSPSEMGDLFKVMILEKNMDIDLLGLKQNNRVTRL